MNRFSGVLLIILFYLLPSYSYAATSYGWPLKENYGISATFGESRNDHFHAGIDLSTNGDTGLPVLAIEDGTIYRMKVQKRAYGRALYIQHAGGTVSVYAHLESYSSDLGLEQKYQSRAEELGTPYVGDIFVDPPIPVKKGDTVAFSGETGAGLPHLHLELRRTESDPVNPLDNGFSDLLDPVPPTFQACYLYPLDADSSVDGELETTTLRLQKQDSVFAPDHIPIIHGDFLLSVSVYDAALRAYHRTPKRISYSVDDQPVFAIDFDAFSYTQPEGFGLVYDLGKPGPWYYEYPILLAKLPGADVPFIKTATPFSARKLSPGLHHITLQASDANDNTSIARIDFLRNAQPSLRIEKVDVQEQDLVASVMVSDPDWSENGPYSLAGDVEFSLDDGRTFVPFPTTMLDLQAPAGSARFFYHVPLAQLQTASSPRILLKARGYDGVEYSPYEVIALLRDKLPDQDFTQKLPAGKLRVTPSSNALDIVFESQEFLTFPLMLDVSGTKYEMKLHDLQAYEAIIPAPRSTGKLSIALNETQQIQTDVIYAVKGTAQTVRGQNFELNLEPDTLYWDTFVWPQSLPAYAAKSLPFIGPMLQLGPRGVPLKQKAELVFQYPDHQQHPERLSIYQWDRGKQKWQSLPSPVDPPSRTVRTGVNVLDLYALIYDNVAPVITPIFPKKYRNTTSNKTPTLAAGIRDSGMDVHDERVTFFVDGVPYPALYDPDRNVATLKMKTPMHTGYHSFRVVAYDYGGNKTESAKITFRVK